MSYSTEDEDMTKFLAAALEKHKRGAAEHKQEWSPKGVDYIVEIKQELLDLYNYSTLDPELKFIGEWAKKTWNTLDRG